MGKEIADVDSAEASELANLLIDHFGGSEEAKEAILDIAEGSGKINQGVQKLIALKEK